MKIIFTLFLILSLSGCYVNSKLPLGDKSHAISADEWEGVWLSDDGVLTLLVNDAEKGQFQLGMVESKENNLVLEKLDVQLRNLGEMILANSRYDEKYAWYLVKKDAQKIIFYRPNLETFKNMVETNQLPGIVGTYDEVTLKKLDDEHLELLKNTPVQQLFNFDDPIILFRYRANIG